MNRIREKLKSERGASILLALLLLLICMMVGASVLMAAASNVGKTRSNKDSHQAHQALSSALWLVIDDLTGKPYYGRYSYQQTILPSNLISRQYTQVDGLYECQLGSVLLDDMDSLFADVMNRQRASDPDANATYTPRLTSGLNTGHELTVVPSDTEHFGDFKVRITVTVGQQNDKGILTLQASLADTEGYEDYMIQAELTAALPTWRELASPDLGNASWYRSGEMQWADPKITRELAEEAGS